jgi:hypothetical protein
LSISALAIAASVALVVVVASLLASDLRKVPLATTLLIGKMETAVPEFLSVYSLFVMMEFGILAIALWRLLERGRDVLAMSILLLLALPFVRLGPGNDIVMRASIPAQAMLCLLLITVVTRPSARSDKVIAQAVAAGFVAVASVTATFEMGRAVVGGRWDANYSVSMREQQMGRLPPHYVGRFDGQLLGAILKTPRTFH